MEWLVPVAIAAIGIGVLIVVLVRRPTVASPPANSQPASPSTRDPSKPLVTIVRRDGKTHITRSLVLNDGGGLSGQLLRDLNQGKNLEEIAQEILQTMPDAAPDAPSEARLAYPGATIVLAAAQMTSSTSGGGQSREVIKTTFATEAGRDEVVAWYQASLTSEGWQPAPSTGEATGAHHYVRGNEHFRLTLADPAAVRAVIAAPIPDNAKTIFEVEYSNAPGQSLLG
jgi:hypothetical protein